MPSPKRVRTARSTRANVTSPLEPGVTPPKGARAKAPAKDDPLAYISDASLDPQSDDDEDEEEDAGGSAVEGIRTEIKGLADAYLEDDLIGKVAAVQADTKASRAGIDGLSTDLKELTKAVVEGHQQLTVTLKSVAAEIVGALQADEPLSRSTSETSRGSRSSASSTASGARSSTSTAASGRGTKRKAHIPVPTDEQLTSFMHTQIRDPTDSGQRPYYSFVCRADEACNRVYKNWSAVNDLKATIGGEKRFKGHDDFKAAALHVKKEIAAMNK